MLSSLSTALKNKQRDFVTFVPFSFLLLFTLTRYITFFGVPIYPTIDRATQPGIFHHFITTSSLDDLLIISLGLLTLYFLIQNKKIIPILASLLFLEIYLFTQYQIGMDFFSLFVVPAIITLVIISRVVKKDIIKSPQSWMNLLYVTSAIVFIFELFVLITWISYPFAPKGIRDTILWHPMSLEFETFYAFADLSPHILILVVFSFLIKPTQDTILKFFRLKTEKPTLYDETVEVQKHINHLSVKLEKINSITRHLSLVDRLFSKSYVESIKNTIVLQKKRLEDLEFSPNIVFNSKIMLCVAIAISIVFAVYPYSPTLNPQYTWISVDDFNYQQFLKQMQQQESPQEIIKQTLVISSGDRPLTLLVMHSFQAVLGLELVTAVRFFPVLLGPGLVLAAYFFVKEGTKNKEHAAYAALLTAFSHQIIVGIYAGFFANWLGLIAAYLCLMVVHRFWEKPSLKNYLLVFGHSVLSFLIYIYVDVYLLLTILVFLIITTIVYRHDSKEKKKILVLSTIFAIYAAIFTIRIMLGSTGLIDTVFSREDISFSIREFQNRWANFPYFMHFYVGGFFANTAILAFAFIWTLYAKYHNTFDRILLASLYAGSIPLVFGDEVLQSRVFYDMPVHIVAAVIIWRLLNRKNVDPLFAKTAFMLITIHFSIYALRSLSNLNFFPA